MKHVTTGLPTHLHLRLSERIRSASRARDGVRGRGLPSLGERDELAERLKKALEDDLCGWEWEQQDVPNFHTGSARMARPMRRPVLRNTMCVLLSQHVETGVCFATLMALQGGAKWWC